MPRQTSRNMMQRLEILEGQLVSLDDQQAIKWGETVTNEELAQLIAMSDEQLTALIGPEAMKPAGRGYAFQYSDAQLLRALRPIIEAVRARKP